MSVRPSYVGWPTSFARDMPVNRTWTTWSPAMVIGFPLAAWVYGGRATSRLPCGGVGGPGSEALPNDEDESIGVGTRHDLDVGEAVGRQGDGLRQVRDNLPSMAPGLADATLAAGALAGAWLAATEGAALADPATATDAAGTGTGTGTGARRGRAAAGHDEQDDHDERTTDRDDQAVLRGLGNAWSYASISVEPIPSGGR